MYKRAGDYQYSLFDFNQPAGLWVDGAGGWPALADRIGWQAIEERYAAMFPSGTGRPAIPVRMALGALVIQRKMGLSDRALVKTIAQSPQLQYFLGRERFEPSEPFRFTSLTTFRRRCTARFLMEINDLVLSDFRRLKDGPSTPGLLPETAGGDVEYAEQIPGAAGAPSGETPGKAQETPAEYSGSEFIAGLVTEAARPSFQRGIPSDLALLNRARLLLESMIDLLHRDRRCRRASAGSDTGEDCPRDESGGSSQRPVKPRTYRRIAARDYDGLVRDARRGLTPEQIRGFRKRQLTCILRDLEYIDRYEAEGDVLPPELRAQEEVIRRLCEQQRYLLLHRARMAGRRVVSLDETPETDRERGMSGQENAPHPGYAVTIDGAGCARLEKLFRLPGEEADCERIILEDACLRCQLRTGRIPMGYNIVRVRKPDEGRDGGGPRAVIYHTEVSEQMLSSVALTILTENLTSCCGCSNPEMDERPSGLPSNLTSDASATADAPRGEFPQTLAVYFLDNGETYDVRRDVVFSL